MTRIHFRSDFQDRQGARPLAPADTARACRRGGRV